MRYNIFRSTFSGRIQFYEATIESDYYDDWINMWFTYEVNEYHKNFKEAEIPYVGNIPTGMPGVTVAVGAQNVQPETPDAPRLLKKYLYVIEETSPLFNYAPHQSCNAKQTLEESECDKKFKHYFGWIRGNTILKNNGAIFSYHGE